MLLLYLIAPLVVAVNPLDDGAKFKQWTTAFVVQSLSVFGTVISMRVILLFMPVVTDPKLVLFDNAVGNLLAKLVIILAGFEVVEKATSLVTGILADNAGWQSITAGDMSGTAKSVVGQGMNLANKYGVGALKSAGGLGLSAVGFGAKTGAKAVAGAGLLAGYGVYGATKAYVLSFSRAVGAELRKKGIKGRRVFVSCVNKDKGAVARKSCSAACIACTKCAKACPFEAITIENNVAYIDYNKCRLCRKCVLECPTGAIVEVNFPPRKVAEPQAEEPKTV